MSAAMPLHPCLRCCVVYLKQLNGIIDGTITSPQIAPAMSRRVPNYRVCALTSLPIRIVECQDRRKTW
jgi:hypothetical protein